MGWRVDTELQQMLRESAQGYLSEAGGGAHFRAVRSAGKGFDADSWARMGELGWTGILLPESAGGSGVGLDPALTLAEEFGRSLAPEPFVASAVIAGTLLAEAGSDKAATLASALASGTSAPVFAWQEASGQIGRPEFTTRLTDGKLHGVKVHVPSWHADVPLLIAAAGEHSPVVVLVEPSAIGVSIQNRAMTDGTFSATVAVDAVSVDDDAILLSGESAGRAIDLALARGTVALSAQLDGLSSALWQMTVDYLRQRVQFGEPLINNQALRHRMVDLYATIELAAASWRNAAEALDAGETSGLALHAAKARCSEVAMAMSRWAIQFHGAFGYTEEADVGLYVHAALTWSSALGNADAHRRRALSAHERRKTHDG